MWLRELCRRRLVWVGSAVLVGVVVLPSMLLQCLHLPHVRRGRLLALMLAPLWSLLQMARLLCQRWQMLVTRTCVRRAIDCLQRMPCRQRRMLGRLFRCFHCSMYAIDGGILLTVASLSWFFM